MKKIYIVILALVVILILAATFFFQASTIYSAQAIAVESSGALGIAPFEDRVDFGDIPAGYTTAKEITLKNEGDSDNHIRVYILGGISNLIKIEPAAAFTIKAGQTQELKLRLTMPATAKPQTRFTGKVIIMRLP